MNNELQMTISESDTYLTPDGNNISEKCNHTFMCKKKLKSSSLLIKYAHNTYDGRTRKDTVGRYIG